MRRNPQGRPPQKEKLLHRQGIRFRGVHEQGPGVKIGFAVQQRDPWIHFESKFDLGRLELEGHAQKRLGKKEDRVLLTQGVAEEADQSLETHTQFQADKIR